MSMVKILHTADCHILSSGSSRHAEKIKNAFFKIISLCKTENADILIIAGDLFDTPYPDKYIVSEIINAFGTIPETAVFIAAGNHDYACCDSVYRRFEYPSNVTLFLSDWECFEIPQKKVKIFGCGFSDRFCQVSRLIHLTENESDFINIGIMHGDLGASESMYNPISTTQIKECGLDYLALGHIHKRTPLQKCGNTFYSYSGCIYGRGFDEEGSHGIYLGTVSKDFCDMKYFEISSSDYISETVDISGCESSFDAAAAVIDCLKYKYGNSFTDNQYSIFLCGKINADTILNTDSIQSILENEINCVNITDNTNTDLDNLSCLAAESSLRGIFVRKMLERMENTEKNDCSELLEALRLGLRAFEGEVFEYDN